MRSKYNKGFTLVELLIASIITTIIISTVGILIYRVAKLNEQLTETQAQSDEIRIIDKNIEVFINGVNKEGYGLYYNSNQVSYDENTKIIVSYDNILINGKTIAFNKIKSIELTLVNSNLLSFKFILDNKEVVKEYYVVGNIVEESHEV